MKFLGALLVSQLLPLLGSASPLAAHDVSESREISPLALRSAPETIYLANCILFAPGYQQAESDIDYYAAGHDSQSGETPDDQCSVDSSGYITWEGQTNSCTFSSSGVTFTSNIESNAASQPLYSKVGTGYNNYHNYNCYRDNDRSLWSQGSSGTGKGCYSVYYCLQA